MTASDPAVATGRAPDPPLHVLFVCTGNLCRSPTAERLVRAHAAAHDLAGLTASSAGTRAVVGAPMDPRSEAALVARGGSGDGFAARALRADDVRAADLVLTMTTRHRARVLELVPGALRRTFTLLEAARLAEHVAPGPAPLADRLAAARARHGTRDDEDVADPFRADDGVHARTAGIVADALAPLLRAAGAPPAG